MILTFIETIEEAISLSAIVISSSLQKYFGPSGKEAYITGKLIFMDLSCLELSIFVSEKGNRLIYEKYRYQYMTAGGRHCFRYDNAPHHRKISTFPMHKHVGDRVSEATMPDFKELLDEISALIITGGNS